MKKKYNDKILSDANSIHKRHKIKNIGIILGGIIIACICIIVSSVFGLSTPWKHNDNWRIILNVGLSTLATVSLASVAWEAVLKYTFSNDVVDLAGISENIRNSGVIQIEESFNDIKWKELLNGKKSIIAVISYSTKWGKNNQEQIKKVAEIGNVTIILPDPNNKKLMDLLKYRFDDMDDLEKRIAASKKYYASLGAHIKYYSKAITDSFYIIDDIAIMATFTKQEIVAGETANVPAFIARSPGTIHTWIMNEVKAILKDTTSVEVNMQDDIKEKESVNQSDSEIIVQSNQKGATGEEKLDLEAIQKAEE